MTKVRVAGHSLPEQDALSEEFTALVTTELSKVLEEFTKLVRYQGLIAAAVPTSPEEIFAQWSATSAGVLADFTQDVYTSGANSIAQKVAGSSLVPPGSGVPGLPASYSASYVAKATNKMQQMAPLMWQNIQTELVAGTAAGESIDKLADRVQHAGNISLTRAQLVARTEVVGASNYGSYDQASLLGDDEGVSKVWEATEDSRTRPDHRHADQQKVPLTGFFEVGGYQMLHPGDFSAPASEVCNCRCTIVYEFDDETKPSLCIGGGPDCVTAPEKVPTASVPKTLLPQLAAEKAPVSLAPVSTPVKTLTAEVKNKIHNATFITADDSSELIWKDLQWVKETVPEADGLSDLQLAKVVDDVEGTGKKYQVKIQEYINSDAGKAAVKAADKTVTPVKPAEVKAPVTVPAFADGDISRLTFDQKAFIKGKTLTDSTITGPNKAIWQTVLNIQSGAAGEDLNALQVLRAMDQQFAEYWGVPNSHWYETKVLKWAKTKIGKEYIKDAKFEPKWGSKSVQKPKNFDAPGTPKTKPVSLTTTADTSPLGSLPSLTLDLQEDVKFSEILPGDAQKLQDAAQKWTSEQKDALQYYTGHNYSQINGWLRGQLKDSSTSEYVKQKARLAQAAMRPSTRPMILWRGTTAKQFGLGDYANVNDLKSLIGKKLEDKGFVSTSVGSNAAFSSKPVLMMVEAPTGSEMAYVNAISNIPGENEMLLAAGTKYIVKDVYQQGFQTIVKVRIIR